MSRLENNSEGSRGIAGAPTSLLSRLFLMIDLQSVLMFLPSVSVLGSVEVDETVNADDSTVLSVADVSCSRAMVMASETLLSALDMARYRQS